MSETDSTYTMIIVTGGQHEGDKWFLPNARDASEFASELAGPYKMRPATEQEIDEHLRAQFSAWLTAGGELLDEQRGYQHYANLCDDLGGPSKASSAMWAKRVPNPHVYRFRRIWEGGRVKLLDEIDTLLGGAQRCRRLALMISAYSDDAADNLREAARQIDEHAARRLAIYEDDGGWFSWEKMTCDGDPLRSDAR